MIDKELTPAQKRVRNILAREAVKKRWENERKEESGK